MDINKTTKASLSNLLDTVEVVHKKDITDLTKGHLNVGHIYTLPTPTGVWENSRKPPPLRLPKNNLLNDEQYEEIRPPTVIVADSQNGEIKLRTMNEDLETAVQNIQIQKPIIWKGEKKVDVKELKQLSAEALRKKYSVNERSRLVPRLLHSVTHRDQYVKMREYDREVVHKDELLSKDLLSGSHAANQIAAKLLLELCEIDSYCPKPNFHRLQVYSDAMEELISQSDTLSPILQVIKTEYDNYLSALLDHKPHKHKDLMAQVDEISEKGEVNPSLLNVVQTQLEQLTVTTKQLLTENQQLREQLEEAIELDKPPPTPICTALNRTKSTVGYAEPYLELVDKVDEAKAEILEKLDSMKELKAVLKSDFVPKIQISNLKQCITHTEVEIKKPRKRGQSLNMLKKQ